MGTADLRIVTYKERKNYKSTRISKRKFNVGKGE